MALVNLEIASITGYTPTERAEAISAELFAISRPPVVRQPDDVSIYRFGWITHPTTGAAILQADGDCEIIVHPDNDLTNLIALMPNLPLQVKQGLENMIKTSTTITFGQLLTGTETTYTEEEMQTNGWYLEETTE